MKARRTGVMVLTASCLAGFMMPTAAAVAAEGPRTLTIEGSRSAEARVDLDQASTVSIEATAESEQVAISGKGRAVGALLERLGDGPPVVLAALKYNLCGTKACEPVQAFEFVTGTSKPVEGTVASEVTLPRGRYRVVLVADGAPVKAEFTLTGLGKSVTIRPEGDSGATFHKITDITETPLPAGITYSGGRTYPASTGAFVGFQELYRTVPGAVAVTGTCIIFGEPPPADAYAPRCPTGDRANDRQEFVGLSTAPAASEAIVAGFGAVPVPKDQQTSIGSYLVSAVPVIDTNVIQIEIPLNRAPQQPDNNSGTGGGKEGNNGTAEENPPATSPASPTQARTSEPQSNPAPTLPATGAGMATQLLGLGLLVLAGRLGRGRPDT